MNGKPLIRMDFPASEHPSKKNGKSILCLSARVDPLNLLIVLTKPMDGRSRMYRSSEIIGKMTENQNYQTAAVCISTFQNCCGLT